MPETIQFLGFPLEKYTLYKLIKTAVVQNGGCWAWIFLLCTLSYNEISNIMILKFLEVTLYRFIF